MAYAVSAPTKQKEVEGGRFTSQLILDWARHHQPPMDTKTTQQKRRFLVCVNVSFFFCVSMVHQDRRAVQFEWKHGEKNAQKDQLQYMSNWWRTWIGASLQPYSVFVFAIYTRISWEFTILISLFRRKTMESSSAKCTQIACRMLSAARLTTLAWRYPEEEWLANTGCDQFLLSSSQGGLGSHNKSISDALPISTSSC